MLSWKLQSCTIWGVSINNSNGHPLNCKDGLWPSQKNQFNQHLADSILYNSLVQLVSKAINDFKTDEAKAKTLPAMEVYKPDNQRGWEKQVMFGESTDPEVWCSGHNAFLIDIYYVIHDCLSQELQWHRHIQKCGIEMRFLYYSQITVGCHWSISDTVPAVNLISVNQFPHWISENLK